MENTYDIVLNEHDKHEDINMEIGETINEQPVLAASNNGSYADMIKNK